MEQNPALKLAIAVDENFDSQPDGVRCAPFWEDGTDTKIMHRDTFKRGRGKFHYFDWIESKEIENNSDEFPFILTTSNSVQQTAFSGSQRAVLLSLCCMLAAAEKPRRRTTWNRSWTHL